MHDQIIHVTVLHQELAEASAQHLLCAELLCADEAVNHYTAK